VNPDDTAGILPAHLREAVAEGWSGLTLLADDGPSDAPVTLVCAASFERLAALGGGGLLIGAVAGPPGGVDPRSLVLAVEGALTPCGHEARLVLDLAYPEARRLVRRAAGQGVIRLVWVPSGEAADARWELVDLGPGGVRYLQEAAARAAEWFTGEPLPMGLEPRHYAAAAREAPRLVGVESPNDEVMLIVPAVVLDGLEETDGEVVLASSLVAGARPPSRPADLELRFTWQAPSGGVIARPVRLSLHDRAQRRLATRMGGQRTLLVLGAEPGAPAPVGGVRVSLGGDGRRLVHLAAHAAARRARA
jgi:hypothetical protein